MVLFTGDQFAKSLSSELTIFEEYNKQSGIASGSSNLCDMPLLSFWPTKFVWIGSEYAAKYCKEVSRLGLQLDSNPVSIPLILCWYNQV